MSNQCRHCKKDGGDFACETGVYLRSSNVPPGFKYCEEDLGYCMNLCEGCYRELETLLQQVVSYDWPNGMRPRDVAASAHQTSGIGEPTYMVMTGRSVLDLVTKVNEAAEEGWKPLGGIASTTAEFLQAISR